jgi:hypothetical protein
MSQVEGFKELHDGKRVFILASSPSIDDLELEPLHCRNTIGLNRAFMIFLDAKYNCTMDQRLFDEYPDEAKKTRYLFTLAGRPWGMPIELIVAEGWIWDLAKDIYSEYTVSYFALQLAVYMGFKEIVYLRLDLKNRAGKTHFLVLVSFRGITKRRSSPKCAGCRSPGQRLWQTTTYVFLTAA